MVRQACLQKWATSGQANSRPFPEARESLIRARAALSAPPASLPAPGKVSGAWRNCFLPWPVSLCPLPLPTEVGRALGILFAGGSGIRFLGGCCCGNYPSNPLPALLSRTHLEKLVISALPFPRGLQTGRKRGQRSGSNPQRLGIPLDMLEHSAHPLHPPQHCCCPSPHPLSSLALRTTSGSLQNSSC